MKFKLHLRYIENPKNVEGDLDINRLRNNDVFFIRLNIS